MHYQHFCLSKSIIALVLECYGNFLQKNKINILKTEMLYHKLKFQVKCLGSSSTAFTDLSSLLELHQGATEAL